MIKLLSSLLLSLVAYHSESPKLELKDGDRIVWLGGTLVEREQKYGYWEAALHAAFPKVSFTFRNLGWSGDTVFGDSRAGFDTAKEGFKRLVDQTLALKPTVIFICYGQNESFDGEAGLARFEKGFETLLDELKAAKARVVLFAPQPFQAWPAAERNKTMQQYTAVVKALAEKRGLSFADVGDQIDRRRTMTAASPPPLTDNGVHLTDVGYKLTDEDFLSALGFRPWDGGPEELKRWRTLDIEPLRKAIVAKNQLFFYRWRPQNETYLFGFRKHEQGKNAKEVAEFDPLVDKAEKEIERIKREMFK